MGKLMTNLTSFLLLLSLCGQEGNCCSTAALASPILAGAGAIGSIISGLGAARDLNYPVDVYPSSCKRNHWQVCIHIYYKKIPYLWGLKWCQIDTVNGEP